MKALAEIQVIPIGVGVSVRKEVRRAHEVLRNSGLKVELCVRDERRGRQRIIEEIDESLRRC